MNKLRLISHSVRLHKNLTPFYDKCAEKSRRIFQKRTIFYLNLHPAKKSGRKFGYIKYTSGPMLQLVNLSVNSGILYVIL
jgi:hypothetical protein